MKKGDGPKQELIDSLKPMTQFFTAQEFSQCINNLCVAKELKVSQNLRNECTLKREKKKRMMFFFSSSPGASEGAPPVS